MTAEDAECGWWDMPALPAWKCPECGVTSPTADWAETYTSCSMCEHDARQCPECGEVFDFLQPDLDRLVEANREPS